jgi:Leucine-rich repeat (LRR) protein
MAAWQLLFMSSEHWLCWLQRILHCGQRTLIAYHLVMFRQALSCIPLPLPAILMQSAASLAKLDLSGNNLSAAAALDPASLASLAHLKVLCLNSCSLTAWPLRGVAPGALDSLHTLEVRSNPLQGLLSRGCLASCPALRSLDLSGEQLRV